MAHADIARGEYLIRGGHVLSLDPDVGELPGGDVHIRDGEIVAVSDHLTAPDAEVVDAGGCVVMPGFVDVHWHMWTSVWRGLAHDAVGYARLHRTTYAFTPEDHYWAVRYAALEAVNAGITTCNNWAHGLRDFSDAEAEMRALVDSGLRARFSHVDTPPGQAARIGVAELERALAWLDEHGDARVSLGIAIHNAEAFPAEVAAARELGLKTIAPHADFSGHLDLLGPDVLYTHGAGAAPEVIGLLAATGAKVGLCPTTDPLIGAGLAPVHELVAGGVAFDDIGFSVDTTSQTAADAFASMRLLLHAGRVAQRGPTSFDQVIAQDFFGTGPESPLMTPRDVIQIVTRNGARVLGLEPVTGSLTPGKRADLIVVRTDQLNMLPSRDADPAVQLVLSGQPENVDTVIADGRVLKRGGRLLGVDAADVVARAAAVQEAILDRSDRASAQQ